MFVTRMPTITATQEVTISNGKLSISDPSTYFHLETCCMWLQCVTLTGDESFGETVTLVIKVPRSLPVSWKNLFVINATDFQQ